MVPQLLRDFLDKISLRSDSNEARGPIDLRVGPRCGFVSFSCFLEGPGYQECWLLCGLLALRTRVDGLAVSQMLWGKPIAPRSSLSWYVSKIGRSVPDAGEMFA